MLIMLQQHAKLLPINGVHYSLQKSFSVSPSGSKTLLSSSKLAESSGEELGLSDLAAWRISISGESNPAPVSGLGTQCPRNTILTHPTKFIHYDQSPGQSLNGLQPNPGRIRGGCSQNLIARVLASPARTDVPRQSRCIGERSDSYSARTRFS